MKKILIGILVFVFSSTSVAAKTYYTEYSDYTEYTDLPISESDTIHVETELRYNWYQNVIELGPYLPQEEIYPDYPLVDLNDTKDSVWSVWDTKEPPMMLNRLIQRRSIYHYQDMKEVRYLHLYDVMGSEGRFRISEIEIFVNGEKVDYTTTCEGCSNGFAASIKNGNTKENTSYIANGGALQIDLNNYYPSDKISFKLYLFDTGLDQKEYHVRMTNDSDRNGIAYWEGYWIQCFTYQNVNEIVGFDHTIEQFVMKDPEWYEEKLTLEEMQETLTRRVTVSEQWRYIDIPLYRHYRIMRDYQNNYTLNGSIDYPFFDPSDSKLYYRYQRRDKLLLANHLVISNKAMQLEDLVVESTSPVTISGTVDYERNGNYPVTFLMNGQAFDEVVTVQILENDQVNYEKEINRLNAELGKQEMEIIALRNEKQKLQDSLLQEKENVKDLKWKIDLLEGELDHLVKANKSIQKSLSDLQSRYQKLEKLYDGKIQELEKTKEKLEQTKSDYVVQTEALKILQSEKEALQKEMKQRESESKQLEQLVEKLKSENQHLQELLSIEREKNRELKEKTNEMIDQNQGLLMGNASLEKDKDQLVKNYQQELIRIDLERSKEQKDYEELMRYKNTCDSELETLKTTLSKKDLRKSSFLEWNGLSYGLSITGTILFVLGIYLLQRRKEHK